MPDVKFLNNVNIEGNETVLGNEYITGNETVSGSSYVTQNLTISGTTLALDTVNLSGDLNITGSENITSNLNVGGVANFAQNINVLSGISTTGNVVASAFYGDGSNLTGIAAAGGAFLPLSGGNMSGAIAFGPYSYSQRIDGGLYDASRGGLSGISLICSVDYDFNWQAGWITALEQDRLTPRPLYIDSGAGTTAKVWDGSSNTGVVISHTGITFADGTTQTTASAFDSTYSTVCANSAQWSVTTDTTKLPLSGGVLTDGLSGTTCLLSTSLSAPAVSGTLYGSGASITNLNASNITSGVLSISAGGTGATDAANARINLGVSSSADVQVLTSAGTWNKPAGAKTVQFVVLGGGGSGQSGGMWDGVTAVAAAAGGGGGGMNDVTFSAASLPASLDVVIGTGGASVSGRTSAGGPINGNAGLPTVLSAGGVIYAYAAAGQGGGVTNNGGVYNGNNGATTSTSAGFNMRGGAGGGRGGGLTAGGVAQNGTGGGEGMAGALPGGAVGAGSNTANGSPGSAGALIGNIVGFTVSSGGGGGGAGKGGGGNSGPGTSGFAVIITHF